MKKLGIIGCGWLGNHLAERLSKNYEILRPPQQKQNWMF
jgi:Trk K+ transport system NAD-binding subunit